MTTFEQQVALVTGASRGIGAACAIDLASRGVKVGLFARSADAMENLVNDIKASGGSAVAISGDVSRFEDVQRAVDTCVGEFGRLDILVNNAGLIEPISRLADSNPQEWAKVIDVNVMGVYHGLRAAVPVMQNTGGGVVVNISSGAATGVLEGWSHYCASKAAVLSLTRCADLEYRDQGIRVVGLSPGTVATDMQVAIKASGINPVSQMEFSQHIPAQWPAMAVAWLCTDAAAEYAGTDFSIKSAENRRLVGIPIPGD